MTARAEPLDQTTDRLARALERVGMSVHDLDTVDGALRAVGRLAELIERGPPATRPRPSPPQLPLTRRQADVYRYVADYIGRRGCAPTHQEVADEIGVAAISTVNECLRAIERKGWIRREYNVQRGISLVGVPLPGGAHA